MQKTTLFAVALAALATTTSAETVKLTTLEWPPYVNADGSGTSTDAVTTAFAAAGDEVVAEVFPWNRAVNLAAKDPNYLGLYPEYYDAGADTEKGGDRCVYSAPFGTSPVGFIHRTRPHVCQRERATRAKRRHTTDGVEIQWYGFTHTDAYRHTQTHANTWRRAWATEGLHLPQGRGGGDLEVGDVL